MAETFIRYGVGEENSASEHAALLPEGSVRPRDDGTLATCSDLGPCGPNPRGHHLIDAIRFYYEAQRDRRPAGRDRRQHDARGLPPRNGHLGLQLH